MCSMLPMCNKKSRCEDKNITVHKQKKDVPILISNPVYVPSSWSGEPCLCTVVTLFVYRYPCLRTVMTLFMYRFMV